MAAARDFAIHEVQAVLSGLKPEVPVRAAEKPQKRAASAKAHPSAPRQPLPTVDITRERATPDELAYTDLLFDFRSVRASW